MELFLPAFLFRPVHIEVAYSLDASLLIKALCRFVAHQVQVFHIWFDNSMNFVGGEHELQDALKFQNQEQVYDFLFQTGLS